MYFTFFILLLYTFRWTKCCDTFFTKIFSLNCLRDNGKMQDTKNETINQVR